ncbi:YkgJ family cysteine cluster protein [Desulfovirgula thermocuniculi]|uniref:YkgJ family cysteine cluster protein n=1 Tax=Desulfovirgula thermocuniculi TaxID=348842 RepID=UPI00040CDA21|nr:YkgJ family cysteine cluster protein [Desulfovirgula thermocuniculi]
MKVRAFPCAVGGRPGYDLEVLAPEATVQDYLEAVNRFIAEEYGGRLCSGGPGRPCTACCWERVPLTYPDVAAYLAEESIREQLAGAPSPLLAFLERFAHVVVDGPVVDVSLARKHDGSCLFLDAGRGRCALYARRPLVCQTYLCRRPSRRAARVRSRVVNAGMDELVRRMLLESRRLGRLPVMHESRRPCPRPEDYDPGPFRGRERFGEVLLRDLLPPGLWRDLIDSRRKGK